MLARSIGIATGGILLLMLLASGCHTVPLGDPEKSVVDPKLNGWWLAEKPGTLVFITPYDARTYVITTYGYEGDAASARPQTKLTNKSWLTAVGGMDVMTFKIIDPEWEFESSDTAAARYSYYRIRKIDADTLEATALNTDFLKDTTTPQELEKKIADNVKNEELWKNSEPMVMKRVTPEKMDDVKKIVRAFAPAKG